MYEIAEVLWNGLNAVCTGCARRARPTIWLHVVIWGNTITKLASNRKKCWMAKSLIHNSPDSPWSFELWIMRNILGNDVNLMVINLIIALCVYLYQATHMLAEVWVKSRYLERTLLCSVKNCTVWSCHVFVGTVMLHYICVQLLCVRHVLICQGLICGDVNCHVSFLFYGVKFISVLLVSYFQSWIFLLPKLFPTCSLLQTFLIPPIST